MPRLIKYLFCVPVWFCVTAGAQVITEEEVIRSAMQTHPLIKAGQLDIQARQYAEKAARGLADPEINVESPTGQFYAVGVLQSFEFPTVYKNQRKLASTQTTLAQTGQLVQENDLRYTVRTLYLDAQMAMETRKLLSEQDSLYQAMAQIARRQFEAGEINFLQQEFMVNEAAKIRSKTISADFNYQSALQQIALYAGLKPDSANIPAPLQYDRSFSYVPSPSSNPNIAYEQQTAQMAAQEIELAKSKTLPGFSVGYLNQGEKITPLDYRFRVAVGVPIWIGQNRAEIATARADADAAQARALAREKEMMQQFQKELLNVTAAKVQLESFEKDILPRQQKLIDTARRMQAAGEIDYAALIRTIDGAWETRQLYLEQIRVLAESDIKLKYLKGL